MSGTTYAYLLASTRRDPYYLDIAPSRQAAGERARFLNAVRKRVIRQPMLLDPWVVVWSQTHDSETAARARIAELGAWPHRWQRRLVEADNPYWLDQRLLDWPTDQWWVVPESTPQEWLGEGPRGVPDAVVAELAAKHNSPPSFGWPLPSPALVNHWLRTGRRLMACPDPVPQRLGSSE